MNDFDYNDVMDYWIEKYDLIVSNEVKEALISKYINKLLPLETNIDFFDFTKNVITRCYLDIKYPHLNLGRLLFSIESLN